MILEIICLTVPFDLGWGEHPQDVISPIIIGDAMESTDGRGIRTERPLDKTMFKLGLTKIL